MHILMLISKIEPSESNVLVGGSVNALVNLCKILPSDVQITVLSGGRKSVKDGVAQFFPARAVVKTVSCRSPAQTARYGAEFLLKAFFWTLFRRGPRIDIVHGHSGYGIYAWVTWLVSKISGARPLHTLYCPVRRKSQVQGRKSGALRSGWAKRALQRMDAVIAMSENIAGSVLDAGVDAGRIRHLPSAVDTDRFSVAAESDELKQRLGVPPGKRVLLFVGNLTESKGIWDLLAAFREVAAGKDDIYLVITLEFSHMGYERSENRFKENLKDYNIENRVIRLGFVDFMADLVAGADALVVPFRDTQGPSDYPLILMEAMAAGTPAVGTAVGGIPELLQGGRNGWLVDPHRPQALSKAIEELLENSAIAAERAKSARNYIIINFGPDKVKGDHMALYEQIISSGRVR